MSWLSSLATNPTLTILFLFLLFLPSQLGRHFWPSFAFINGLRIDYLSPTLYFTDILFCLLLLEMLPNILRAMKQPLSWVVVAVLGLFSYLSLTSQLPLNSLWGVVRLLQVVLLIWFFSFAMKRQSNRLTLALAIAISLIYSSLLAIWQFINQSSVGGLWYYLGERSFTSLTPGIADASLRGTVVLRPYATFPHPNVLAGFCIIMVTYLLLLAPSSALRWWQGLKGVALGLGMVALVVSLSRGAIVVGGLVGIVWFISRALASPRRQKIFVGVCVVLVFLAWQTGLLLRL
ncbi:MAG TPA: hypothetical protein VG935_05045, partial [Patescibacteria group bacterium]|nr:hypothetical protein [Patescibacteria group bacterium]